MDQRTLRLVEINDRKTIAVVHPPTGAFAYLKGTELVNQVRDRTSSIQAGPFAHTDLDVDDPAYGEVWRAMEDYVLEAADRPKQDLDTIIIKLTNRCNEACLHCYDAVGDDDRDMEKEGIINAVSEALALCGKSLHLLFHGGEPLLRSDLIESVADDASRKAERLGKELGFFVMTNASILNDRIVSVLERHNFAIGISLDGPADMHDKMRVMRNGDGTYRLFERTYNRYKEYLTSNAGIMTTVMASNVSRLDEVAMHIRDLGFLTWDETLFDLSGRGALYPEMAVVPQDYFKSYCRILDRIENGEFDNIALKPVLRRLDNLILPQKLDMCLPGNGPCGAGNRLLSLSSDGVVRACDIIFDKSLDLGSLPADNLENALRSAPVQKMDKRLDNLKNCSNCTWLGVCGGTCLARSSLNSVSEIDCRLSKLINPELLKRMARSEKIQKWYERFPPSLRRASQIKQHYGQGLE